MLDQVRLARFGQGQKSGLENCGKRCAADVLASEAC